MDFSCWQAALPKYDVIAVLGRSAVLPGGALIELLGFLLQEKTLRLYLLQYDGEAAGAGRAPPSSPHSRHQPPEAHPPGRRFLPPPASAYLTDGPG